MKSLYNKVFKNNQVTYGRPFQVIVPKKLQNIAENDIDTDEETDKDITDDFLPNPEELLEKAKYESEQILKEAGFEAERQMEKARQEAEKKAKALQEEAWQKGYAEGMESANIQNETILAEAEEIRRSAAQEHDSIMLGLENEILELVLAIARKAVAGELVTNKDIILQLIRDALPNCSNIESASVKVSPLDYELLISNKEEIFAMAEDADGINIKRDCTLKSGDCIIETSLGSVDAGVATRLDKIEQAFREQYEGR